jgi:hypothetical protein
MDTGLKQPTPIGKGSMGADDIFAAIEKHESNSREQDLS